MKRINYKTALKYLFAFLTFLTFSSVKAMVPLSLAPLSAFLLSGFNMPILFILNTLSDIIASGFPDTFINMISSLFLCVCLFIVKKNKINPLLTSTVFTTLSLIPFVFAKKPLPIDQKLLYSTIIVGLAIISLSAVRLIFFRVFNKKSYTGELCSLGVFAATFIFGACNFAGIKITGALCLFVAVCCCFFFKDGRAMFSSLIISTALALNSCSLDVIAFYQIITITALLFMANSKLLAGISVIIVQVVWYYVDKTLFTFSFWDYMLSLLPTVLFLFAPQKLLEELRKKLIRFDERIPAFELVNRERGELSSILYSLSSVFFEVEKSMLNMSPMFITDDLLIEQIADEVIISACSECRFRQNCLCDNKPKREDLIKLISVGVAKGKVNVVDIPKDFAIYCYSTNTVLYEINKLLATYQEHIERSNSTHKACKLVTLQAGGLAEVLRNLAYDFSKQIGLDGNTGKNIFNSLCYEGIVPVNVVAIEDNCEFHLVFDQTPYDFTKIGRIISSACGFKVGLVQKTNLGNHMLAVYKKVPKFDACFGISRRTKDFSTASGDTHTLTKIDRGNFLVALCDGMGSGENAHENSSVAISVIENFYRAKLGSERALELSNKLISLCREDSFCAIDIAIIDLYKGFCDIVKVGAPFGFLLCKEGIKIIEQPSAPLGILDEINTQTLSLQLSDGDMVVMLSDGVTDAFFSSTDLVEFLSSERSENAQLLSDKIIAKAVDLSGEKTPDDMTAIIIKVFANQ